MDLEQFMLLERQQLKMERQRLSARTRKTTAGASTESTMSDKLTESHCPAGLLLQSNNYKPATCRRPQSAAAGAELQKLQNSKLVHEGSELTVNTMSSLATAKKTVASNEKPKMPDTALPNSATQNEATFSLYTEGSPVIEADNAAAFLAANELNLDLSSIVDVDNAEDEILKSANEWKNRVGASARVKQNTITSGKHNTSDSERHTMDVLPLKENRQTRKRNDDMEQWVSDTFYSYFPGFNNENQKRQNYLRERQRENQQNLLKHQMLHPLPSKHAAAQKSRQQTIVKPPNQSNLNTARSTASTTTSNNTSGTTTTDKTELEIIVNNPNYVPPKQKASRSSITRNKLLQDLQHTELSQIITGDAVVERNLRSAELETARKKDYQRDLMQQIDEKRRSIELLREKERKQEEALTRRLEAQLKTMKLEEQLERERVNAEKAIFASEQSRLMREHLLAKLENDKKLLYAKKMNYEDQVLDTHKKEATFVAKATTSNQSNQQQQQHSSVADGTSNKNNNNNNVQNDNKVYKYFSNSARHEYRRGQPMPADVEFDLQMPEITKIERECFHLCDKVCPYCDEPLKSYESCCLRCQRKLALKMRKAKLKKTPRGTVEATNAANQKISGEIEYEEEGDIDDDDYDDECAPDCRSTYALVCVKCERLYALCPICLAKNDVCRACHRKRNVCMNCRRTLCTFCLQEVACGRDSERRHINEVEDVLVQQQQSNKADSFRVLEVSFAAPKESDVEEASGDVNGGAIGNSNYSPPIDKNLNYQKIHNNLDSDNNEINIAPHKNQSYSTNDLQQNRPPYSMNVAQHNNPPYSMNIARDSIFHPEYKPTPAFEQLPTIMSKKSYSFDLDSSPTDEQTRMERVRKDTNKHLSRYLKNYGDLATLKHQPQRSKSESHNRSTQTTPESSGRRDIVLHETTHNLSMPLLREMPKMTRRETSNLLERTALNNQRKIDSLKRRWEIPAVQKFRISTNSPKVLTQVGAIRKQMQADCLLDDEDY